MPELLDSCRSALMLGFDGGKMGLRPTFRQSGTWTAEQGWRSDRDIAVDIGGGPSMVRWIRILLVVLGSIWRPKLGPDGQSVLNLRVWITDADFFAVSVGAYLTYFEMGRVDLQLRTGFARLAMKMRWFAPTRSIVVEYWKPLRRFQRFQVFVKVLYWDDRWVYTEERIERNGSSIATALCKSTVLGRAGRIAPAAVASALGFEGVPPSQPLLVRKLQEAEELMREPAEGLCRS